MVTSALKRRAEHREKEKGPGKTETLWEAGNRRRLFAGDFDGSFLGGPASLL